MKEKAEKRVRAPRGFHFTIRVSTNACFPSSDYAIVSLRDSKNPAQEIGHVSLYRQFYPKMRRDHWETHSQLDSRYWGQGLGGTMYAKAIQWCLDRGYKVRSSGASSDMAKRVWNGKKIRQYFSIRKRTTRWGNMTWFAFH